MDAVVNSMKRFETMIRNAHIDYVKWIESNPKRASDMETSVKLFSYLLHGKFKGNSSILPELLYCSSNLLAFWHDSLLRKALDRTTKAKKDEIGEEGKRDAQVKRIKSILTIVEYFEVFLEVSARTLWGDFGRWLIILIVQSIKTGLRGALLFHFKIGMIESPALQPFSRRGQNSSYTNGHTSGSFPNLVFVLKHSGRVVRKIHASPPINQRNWKLPAVGNQEQIGGPQNLSSTRLMAEVIHVLRPMAHLLGLSCWGMKSWKPWMLSLAIDISSLQMHGNPSRMNWNERNELSRRTYALFYYLIRSPFYDNFTKRRVLTFLTSFGSRIPIVGQICQMLAQAIPEWQDTYSYVWNDS